MVEVILPPALLQLFPAAQARIEVRALSVAEMLDALEMRYPGMRDRLRDSSPAIRRHIRILVDGRVGCLETRLEAGDEVFVLTAISGG